MVELSIHHGFTASKSTGQCSWSGNRFLGQSLDLYDARHINQPLAQPRRKENCLPRLWKQFFSLVFQAGYYSGTPMPFMGEKPSTITSMMTEAQNRPCG